MTRADQEEEVRTGAGPVADAAMTTAGSLTMTARRARHGVADGGP